MRPFLFQLLCFIRHDWSPWAPDIRAERDRRYCRRCGATQSRRAA
jgi:hypothetical protein